MSGPRPGEPPPQLPERGEAWIETRAGSLFFLNAVLVAPVFVVLVPLVLGWVLRGLGVVEGPSPILDPVPAVFAHMGRWLGWLAAVPLALALRSLRIVDRPGARAALVTFALAHLGVLCWTALQWIG